MSRAENGCKVRIFSEVVTEDLMGLFKVSFILNGCLCCFRLEIL